MRSRSPLFLLIVGLGAGGAASLFWLWRQNDDVDPIRDIPVLSQGSAPRTVDRAVSTAAAATAPLDSAMRSWLEALAQAIRRGEARKDEALLSFKDEAALQRFLQRARGQGLAVLAHSGPLRTVRVRSDNLRSLDGELAENAAEYESVSANSLFSVPQPPAQQERAELNQIPFGNETLAYLGASVDRTNWGRGVTIAILDTGVGADPTFSPGQLHTLDLGLGITPGRGADDGHGTSVGALAAGMSGDAAGVAPAATLLSIRVTDTNGLSDLFTLSQGIVAAVDAGARIINVSLGGYATGSMLDAAIGYAAQQGAVIVAAAGNDQAAQLTWPAADPRVVSVGAIDRAEQQVAFSNAGEQLQFTAPGYGVQTAWLDGQRAYVNGTSASAPLVSGAIAALISQNPNLTPAQAVTLLAQTANDGGAPGTDPAYGRGIINLGTAMNSGNPSYVDTAISSHHYDSVNQEMQFIVQNRSGRALTGTSLAIAAGTVRTIQTLPTLAPGETYIAKVPVNPLTLNMAGSITYTTQLTNPLGVIDQVPGNNQKSTTFSPPKP
jgi:hypothetical protein